MTPDRLDYIVGAGEHIVVPEAQNFVSVSLQKVGPAGVVRRPLRFVVLAAVDFHDQLSFKAGEVNDVGSDTMLSAEVTAEPVRAKASPESLLCFRHVAP
jgi:hypothetical protein